MSNAAVHRVIRAQFREDFPAVCDSFGFDDEYRALLLKWLACDYRAMRTYRTIAFSLTGE